MRLLNRSGTTDTAKELPQRCSRPVDVTYFFMASKSCAKTGDMHKTDKMLEKMTFRLVVFSTILTPTL
jgi:hypothetical protein